MFKKTRLRLVILYSLVFFLLLNFFGAILFVSTQQRLYAQTDHVLRDEVKMYSFFVSRQFRRDFPYRPIQRMSYLLWDDTGDLVYQIPKDVLDEATIDQFSTLAGEDNIQMLSVGSVQYRIIGQRVDGGYIQIGYNMEPERNVLDSLLVTIGVGGVISVIIAVLAGYFLANRALVPVRKAWDQQQQFVSDASHELRTPLSVLQLNLERMFRHPDKTIEQQSRNISVMIDETRRISRLVGDLLTLARSDSNQLQIVRSPVIMNEIVEDLEEQFHELAEMKSIQIRVGATDGEPVLVSGDKDYLRQLFVILMDNAIKYTASGAISLDMHRSGAYVHVKVSDTGIGIAPEHLPLVFDRFYRADKVRNRTDGGTGLGLSIAKWIVEAHGGSIQLESEPGKGTTVHVKLPATG